MSPPFLFEISEFVEAGDAPMNVNLQGNWIPSTVEGANVALGRGVSGYVWYCNGQQIYQIPQLPQGALHYSTYSMYYSTGHGFWVLRGDATQAQDWESWHPLRFEWDSQNYSSYLTNAGQQNSLRTQRASQLWPRMLLPDIYHTESMTGHQSYGGLRGELPILLGLIAHMTTRENLAEWIPRMFQGGAWMEYDQYVLPIRRTNQRGVRVTVYTVPTSWSANGTANDLTQYENGAFGNYYH